MKYSNKLLVFGAFALTVFGYAGTHSDLFVSRVYEHKMINECGIDIMCRMGAAILEAPVVSCMEDRALSWTDNTVAECLNKVTNEVKGE